MKPKKLILYVIIVIMYCILSVFQLAACGEKNNNNDKVNNVVDEYQEIMLTPDNFLDYYIPTTSSTLIRSYKYAYAYAYEYKVDYSIKCKYSKAINNDVSVSFKVDYESYYDSDNNLISKDVIKTMYLTDAGVGELSHNYTSYAISGVTGPSGGGIELSEFTIKSVTGTIKIPKN